MCYHLTDRALSECMLPVVRFVVSRIRSEGAVSWWEVETVCGDGRRLALFEERARLFGVTPRSICQTFSGSTVVGYTVG